VFRSDGTNGDAVSPVNERREVLIAGPSSSLTIPGIVVSQIVEVLARSHPVTRIEVDDPTDFDSGLFRAPSLAAALNELVDTNIVVHEAPSNPRLRNEAFEKWLSPRVHTAVAFVWPTIDSSWVRQFIEDTKSVGATAIVVCASVPKSTHARLSNLAELVFDADLVLVGTEKEASTLRGQLIATSPIVESHSALSLGRRVSKSAYQEIMAFLPKGDVKALSTLLSAFDAIPEAWIDSYRLDVVMRYTGGEIPEMIDASYHSEYVTLIGEDISSEELVKLVSASSALIVADPAIDSRAFHTAAECGLPIVVLADTELPIVGRGYVGALLANMHRSVSVYVALTHALRLADLQFPRPDEWRELVERLLATSEVGPSGLRRFEPSMHVR